MYNDTIEDPGHCYSQEDEIDGQSVRDQCGRQR